MSVAERLLYLTFAKYQIEIHRVRLKKRTPTKAAISQKRLNIS